MSNKWKDVIDFFRPPEKYFWQWAENGHVIEWRDGDTICYRDELMAILKQLEATGWPSFGSILLVISACREKHETLAAKEGILYSMLGVIDYYEKNKLLLKGLK